MVIAKGNQMEATDMLNLAFFPKGMILMYKGSGWQDNVTLKGWYICNGQTVNGEVLPNLIDKFVRGSTSSGDGIGSDYQDITLTQAMLPAHTHDYSGTTTSNGVHNHSLAPFEQEFTANGRYNSTWIARGTAYTGDAGAHTHTFSGQTNSIGAGNSFRVNTVPVHYKLIYIIKMSPHGSVSI